MRNLLILIAMSLAIALPISAQAAAVMVAEEAGVVLTLHDDACTLTNVVSNLPYRITWLEKGKQHEGCFGASDETLMAYFGTDRTVAVIPFSIFKRVVGV